MPFAASSLALLDQTALWAADAAAVWLSRLFRWGLPAAVFLAAFTGWYALPVTTTCRVATAQGGPPVRLALVTDLHSCRYGKGQQALVRRIERINPDLVLLGGDIFDDRIPDDATLELLDSIAPRRPCFYVTGNHEFWSGRHPAMKAAVRARGIAVLEGTGATVEVRGRKIDVCGLDDPTYMEPGEWHPPLPENLPADDPTCHLGGEWRRQLEAATAAAHPGHLKILLTHRPERVADYQGRGFDFVLCGHTHGGQVALPFGLLPGLFAPNQGFFPKYAAGVHDLGNGTTMVVSRGLARKHWFFPRWFNHPEVVIVEVK
jgi:hypothetical protein